MEIFDGIYSVPGERCIFIKPVDLLVISDLQLGEERYLAEEMHIYIPEIQLKKELEQLDRIASKVNASRVLIDGDIKHEFGEASRQEWREVTELIDKLKKLFKEIIVVRGNHDNFLINILKQLNISVYDEYLEKSFLFVHGHRLPETENYKILIIGHEEPTILLKRGYDRVKLPVILFGSWRGKKLVVLPAFSPLSEGATINGIYNREDIISPIIKETNISKLKAIGIVEPDSELYLGEIGRIALEF
jgi:putative SbcD/Mre11-related phosphoesterase